MRLTMRTSCEGPCDTHRRGPMRLMWGLHGSSRQGVGSSTLQSPPSWGPLLFQAGPTLHLPCLGPHGPHVARHHCLPSTPETQPLPHMVSTSPGGFWPENTWELLPPGSQVPVHPSSIFVLISCGPRQLGPKANILPSPCWPVPMTEGLRWLHDPENGY